jgi:cell division control protein 11
MSAATRRRGNKAKKAIQFTVMVVGASGTGRTTFVNTLCESEVLPHKVVDDAENAHIETPIKIKPVNVGEPLCCCLRVGFVSMLGLNFGM